MTRLLIILLIIGCLIVAAKAWCYVAATRAVRVFDAADEIVVNDRELGYLAREDKSLYLSHPDGMLFAVSNRTDLATVRRMLRVVVNQPLLLTHCRCIGDYELVVKAHGEKLAGVGYAHSSHMKYVPDFSGDLYLQDGAAAELTEWIRRNTPFNIAEIKRVARESPNQAPEDTARKLADPQR